MRGWRGESTSGTLRRPAAVASHIWGGDSGPLRPSWEPQEFCSFWHIVWWNTKKTKKLLGMGYICGFTKHFMSVIHAQSFVPALSCIFCWYFSTFWLLESPPCIPFLFGALSPIFCVDVSWLKANFCWCSTIQQRLLFETTPWFFLVPIHVQVFAGSSKKLLQKLTQPLHIR